MKTLQDEIAELKAIDKEKTKVIDEQSKILDNIVLTLASVVTAAGGEVKVSEDITKRINSYTIEKAQGNNGAIIYKTKRDTSNDILVFREYYMGSCRAMHGSGFYSIRPTVTGAFMVTFENGDDIEAISHTKIYDEAVIACENHAKQKSIPKHK